ncbi:hypothetical protein [Streptomyces sp. DHE17-7]|uniref:hypothetical protein n=1 Tax=Streptomyces sp. DHE17-7 TaxID=2759949 RepID=UPI0022EB1E08|nr:hypothetical protein [Streptomyces sp. DHE17-7]
MLKSIWLTLLLTVLGVVLQTPLSILLGVWAAGHQRNRAVLSVIYFIPLLLSATAVSVLWRALLDPNFGIPPSRTLLFATATFANKPRHGVASSDLAVHPVPHPDLPGCPRVPRAYQARRSARPLPDFHITAQLRTSMITSISLYRRV